MKGNTDIMFKTQEISLNSDSCEISQKNYENKLKNRKSKMIFSFEKRNVIQKDNVFASQKNNLT